MHSELPAAEPWETEFIAQLCRQHEGSKAGVQGTAFASNKARRDAFVKLLALLRIVDCLDTGPGTVIQLRRIELLRGQIKLRFTGRNLTGLEEVAFEKRAAFFERVLKRKLVAIRD